MHVHVGGHREGRVTEALGDDREGYTRLEEDGRVGVAQVMQSGGVSAWTSRSAALEVGAVRSEAAGTAIAARPAEPGSGAGRDV
jgi:hypothetical protein